MSPCSKVFGSAGQQAADQNSQAKPKLESTPPDGKLSPANGRKLDPETSSMSLEGFANGVKHSPSKQYKTEAHTRLAASHKPVVE